MNSKIEKERKKIKNWLRLSKPVCTLRLKMSANRSECIWKKCISYCVWIESSRKGEHGIFIHWPNLILFPYNARWLWLCASSWKRRKIMISCASSYALSIVVNWVSIPMKISCNQGNYVASCFQTKGTFIMGKLNLIRCACRTFRLIFAFNAKSIIIAIETCS